MRYLTADEVIALHDQEDNHPLRERHLLESAVGAPQHTFDGQDLWPTIHQKAACLLRSLAENQPFADGNKRTAWHSVTAFYGFNGYRFSPPDIEMIHLLIDLAVADLDVPKIANTIELWAIPIELPSDLDHEGAPEAPAS